MTLSLSEYAAGLALFLFIVGGSLWIATMIVRRLMGELGGVPRALAIAILATAVLVAVHLTPAMLGILGPEAVATATMIALGLAALVPARTGARLPSWPEARGEDTGPSRVIAAIGCAAVSIYILAVVLALGDEPATNVDTVTFHLPGVARWIETGSIWQIDQFVPDQSHGYYPNTGNVVELAAVLPWRSDFLIRLIGLPFIGIAAVATYGIGRELGAAKSPSALAAALAISIPAVSVYAVEKPTPDAIALAGFATGALFLIRHTRTGLLTDLVVAGLGLGLAFGTKWYGVSAAIAVVAVWALARLACRRGLAPTLRDAGIVFAITAAVGGIWLLRNWIESGDPLFPLRVTVLGVTLFDPPRDLVREQFGFAISHYAFDLPAWRDFILPAYRDYLALPGAALIIGAIAWVAGVGLRERAQAARGLALAAAALAIAILYLITPAGALGPQGAPGGAGVNSRYLIPALMLAAPIVALGLSALTRWRLPLEVVVLTAIFDGLLHTIPTGGGALAAAVVLAAAAAGAWILLEGRTSALVAASVTALALASVAGYQLQRSFNDQRYRDDPVLGSFSDQFASDHRVGIAGFWPLYRLQPVLPAFGPRLGNEVEYVGFFDDGMLRPLESESEFVAELREREYDLLLIGDLPLPTRAAHPLASWARLAGYREIARDAELTLFAAPSVQPR